MKSSKRWLKRLLIGLLLYIGAYLIFIAVLQALTGYDFTAAYAAVTGVGSVELIVSSLIKQTETKKEKASKDAESEIDNGEGTELHTGNTRCYRGDCGDSRLSDSVDSGDAGEAESADQSGAVRSRRGS